MWIKRHYNSFSFYPWLGNTQDVLYYYSIYIHYSIAFYLAKGHFIKKPLNISLINVLDERDIPCCDSKISISEYISLNKLTESNSMEWKNSIVTEESVHTFCRPWATLRRKLIYDGIVTFNTILVFKQVELLLFYVELWFFYSK